MKTYRLKLYNLDGSVWESGTELLSFKSVISQISFSSNINGGQGELRLTLNLPLTTTAFGAKYIDVYCYDEVFHPTGIKIFGGITTIFTKKFVNNKETIELSALGKYALLSRMFYGGVFSVNTDPANVVKAIVDNVLIKYPGSLSYAGGNVTNFGSNYNRNFSYTRGDQAIKEIVQFANFWFYIDQNGEAYYKAKPVAATHTFTYGKDIEEITIEQNQEGIINHYEKAWSSAPTATSANVPSQTTYGYAEDANFDTDLASLAAAQQYADNQILQNKDPKLRTKVVVNSNYDIESIMPGNTIKVRNMDNTIVASMDNMQVYKILYTPDKVTLELEEIRSFSKTLLS